MKITSKKQFYELAAQGKCGNTPKTWTNPEDYVKEKDQYPYIGIRFFQKMHTKTKPNITLEEALAMPRGSCVITEVPPKQAEMDGRYGLQGELSWLDGQWVFYYTHELGYMRAKLQKSGQHAYGMTVNVLLWRHMSDQELEMLQGVFERYTDGGDYPVIEFSVLPVPCGVYKMNTLIWEVRNGY